MNPGQKKDAAGGAAAPSETSLLTNLKHRKGLALAQYGSNAHFDKIAAAVRAQQAGARFAAGVVAQPSLPDALFIQVCEYFSDPEFLKNFLRVIQKTIERLTP